MAISFGGLATGLDTNTIVTEMMELERRPIVRLEADKQWYNNRLSALLDLDGKLRAVLDRVRELDSSEDLGVKKTTLSSEEFFSATVSSEAAAGTYQVEVIDLAQTEKEVSQGYADQSVKSFGTGLITLTVGGGAPVDITIDATNNSLEGIKKAINDAQAGVTAAIINDGTGSPYRLILTGDEVAKSFTVDASALTGGTYANPLFTETQSAGQAHIKVDGIDIYSTGNVLSEAIPNVTLSLTQAGAGTKTTLTVGLDEAAIKNRIQAFVTDYNAVLSFVTGQAKTEEKPAGILAGDSGMNAVKHRLQDLLSTRRENSGVFSSLSELGLATQKDGTLKLDDATLTEAVQNNLASVKKLLAGETGVEGVATSFKSYLDGITHPINGFYFGRKKSIEASIHRIDNDITHMEARLEKREKTLLVQFTALEQLVSVMNTQSNYITQQMDMLSNLWSRKK